MHVSGNYIASNLLGDKYKSYTKFFPKYIANTIIARYVICQNYLNKQSVEICRLSESYDTRVGYKHYLQPQQWKSLKSNEIVISLRDEDFDKLIKKSLLSDVKCILNTVGLTIN